MNLDPIPFLWTDPNTIPGQVPSQLIVTFKEVAQKNEEETRKQGFDVFDNVLIAEVTAGGQQAKSTVIHEIERKLPSGEVKPNVFYSRKYASVLDQYKTGRKDIGTGTPLHFLEGMDAGRIATLKAQGVHFIETLAAVAESSSTADVMGFREMVAKAKRFLELREKNAPMVKMDSELKERDAKIANLERQLSDLIQRFGEPEAEKPRRGRPPKVQEAA